MISGKNNEMNRKSGNLRIPDAKKKKLMKNPKGSNKLNPTHYKGIKSWIELA